MAFDPESLFLQVPADPVLNEATSRRRGDCIASVGRYSLRSCAEDTYGEQETSVNEALPEISAEDVLPLPYYERGILDKK